MPRSYAAGAAALAVLLLAGCGGDDLGDKPDLPDETPALWNPCDVLDARLVEREFGSVATEENGTDTAPDCRLFDRLRSGRHWPCRTAHDEEKQRRGLFSP